MVERSSEQPSLSLETPRPAVQLYRVEVLGWPRQEIPQQVQPNLMALLRMELRAEDVPLLKTGDEWNAVVARGCDDLRIVTHYVITVHEVEVSIFPDPFE